MTAASPVVIDIKDKITLEQWKRLNEVANEAISCGYFTEDGQTEKALIEDEAVERFVQFLENYFVTEDDKMNEQ